MESEPETEAVRSAGRLTNRKSARLSRAQLAATRPQVVSSNPLLRNLSRPISSYIHVISSCVPRESASEPASEPASFSHSSPRSQLAARRFNIRRRRRSHLLASRRPLSIKAARRSRWASIIELSAASARSYVQPQQPQQPTEPANSHRACELAASAQLASRRRSQACDEFHVGAN